MGSLTRSQFGLRRTGSFSGLSMMGKSSMMIILFYKLVVGITNVCPVEYLNKGLEKTDGFQHLQYRHFLLE